MSSLHNGRPVNVQADTVMQQILCATLFVTIAYVLPTTIRQPASMGVFNSQDSRQKHAPLYQAICCLRSKPRSFSQEYSSSPTSPLPLFSIVSLVSISPGCHHQHTLRPCNVPSSSLLLSLVSSCCHQVAPHCRSLHQQRLPVDTLFSFVEVTKL